MKRQKTATDPFSRYRNQGDPIAARSCFESLLSRTLMEERERSQNPVAQESVALARVVRAHILRNTQRWSKEFQPNSAEATDSNNSLSLAAKKVVSYLLVDIEKVFHHREWRRLLTLALVLLPPIVAWMLQVRPAIVELTDLRVLGAPLLMLFANARVIGSLGLPMRRKAVPLALFFVAFLFLNLSFLVPWHEPGAKVTESSTPAQNPNTCILTMIAGGSLVMTAIQYLALSVGPLFEKRERVMLAIIVWSSGLTTTTICCYNNNFGHIFLTHLLPGFLLATGSHLLFQTLFRQRLRRDLPLAVAKRVEELKV